MFEKLKKAENVKKLPGTPPKSLPDGTLEKLPEFPEIRVGKPLHFNLGRKEGKVYQFEIDSSGIYGYSGGSASFYINSSGDAYFEGDIGASTVDASLLVYNENYIKFFSDDGSFAQGFIYGDGNDELRISTVESGSNINIIADENYKINFEEWDSGLGDAYTRATIDSNGLEVSGSLSDGSTSRDVTNIVESEKVVIGTSSPDDTSALWIDTS